MKHLLILISTLLITTIGFPQDVTPEIFRAHVADLAKHPVITKTFSMIDEQNNFHLYIDVSGYNEYDAERPIEFEGHKVFLWQEGSIAFYDVEQTIRLVTIMKPGSDIVVYEFISQVDLKRFLIQSRFVFRNEKWELADLKRTRIKMTKNERKFLY
ncbi:MAG: hypothetical protein IH598_12525 [Bacteroidales bacterium]|nr:hypothetical protein [Bacteroidales bacterium]